MGRRRFLAYTSGCLFCAAGRAQGAAAEEAKPVDIGSLKDFAKDGISEAFIQHKFFVVRFEGRLFAPSATCTHQGNELFRDPQNPTRINCSGHESIYDPEGTPVVGPAEHGLPRLGISLDGKGRIVVDPRRKFEPEQWQEQGSYLEIEQSGS